MHWGYFFQFICNNLVRSQMVQLIFVFILFAATVYYLLIRKEAVELEPVDKGGKQNENNRIYIGFYVFVV